MSGENANPGGARARPSLSPAARPRAQTLLVSDVLKRAADGQLRVPEFQTGLRWRAREVEELFDSMLRGFPIGSLLFWKRATQAEILHFGPVRVEAPARDDALHIVDGQQRVTSLVATLLQPEERPVGGIYAAWVNLQTEEVRVFPSRPSAPVWLPLNLFGQRILLQRWSRAADFGSQTEAFTDKAFEVEEKLVRFEVPTYIIEEADSAALKTIFKRVNSTGVALTEAQVFQALFGDGNESKPLDAMAAAIRDETCFGEISTSWLLRCVKAVGDLDPRKSFSEVDLPDDQLLSRTRSAFRLAVRFLQAETPFLHAAVLPYRFPIIVLSRFFDLHSEPEARTRQLLARWVWRGAVSGAHGSSSQAEVSANLADIGEDEHGSIQRLLARVDDSPDLPSAETTWNGRAAVTRLYAAVMLGVPPLRPDDEDEFTREQLLASLSERQIGQTFPRVHAEAGNGIDARLFQPGDRGVVDLHDAAPELLGSYLIPEAAAEAGRAGDWAGFAQLRRAAMEERMRASMRRYASTGAGDRPPIRELAGR